MSEFEEVLGLARRLSAADRERLTRELGSGARVPLTPLASLADRPPAPHSVAWVKAERGHAVLATDTGPADEAIPTGPKAIRGMWADIQGQSVEPGSAQGAQ